MKKILIIDDNVQILDNIAELLELEGYKVITTTNGQKGVETGTKEMPDLIICDITMPGMDGFNVFLNLNKNIHTADIPFIFLTGNSELSTRKHGMDLGGDDYITKPFEPEYLLTVVKKRIEKHERAKREREGQLHNYINELEIMLHMTSHRVRAPLCTCLGLIDLLGKITANNPGDLEIATVITHIKSSFSDLDNFTRDLTNFLSKVKEKKLVNLMSSVET